MRTIYKYQLEVTDEQTVEIPAGAVLLDVQVQNGIPCMWCVVEPTANKFPYKVWIAGTGHPMIKYPCFYAGTFQLPERGLVFHVFTELNQFNG